MKKLVEIRPEFRPKTLNHLVGLLEDLGVQFIVFIVGGPTVHIFAVFGVAVLLQLGSVVLEVDLSFLQILEEEFLSPLKLMDEFQ